MPNPYVGSGDIRSGVATTGSVAPCVDPPDAPGGYRPKYRTPYAQCMCRHLSGANHDPSWKRKFKFCYASQVCQRSPVKPDVARRVCLLRVGPAPVKAWEGEV